MEQLLHKGFDVSLPCAAAATIQSGWWEIKVRARRKVGVRTTLMLQMQFTVTC